MLFGFQKGGSPKGIGCLDFSFFFFFLYLFLLFLLRYTFFLVFIADRYVPRLLQDAGPTACVETIPPNVRIAISFSSARVFDLNILLNYLPCLFPL